MVLKTSIVGGIRLADKQALPLACGINVVLISVVMFWDFLDAGHRQRILLFVLP